MCRPLHASWVNGKVYTVKGEGSHAAIAGTLNLLEPLYDAAGLPPLAGRVFEGLFPFEGRWTMERKALFQPNINKFYDFDELPSRKQFDMANEQFDKDMGTPDRLRDWVLAAAELYGKEQITRPGSTASYWLGGTQPLSEAANSVLREDSRVGVQRCMTPEESVMKAAMRGPLTDYYAKGLVPEPGTAPNENFFKEWADKFSSKKNRVRLWEN